MSLTEKEIYDLNNRNVASQNVQLGTILSNQSGNPLTEKQIYDLTNDNVITQKVEFGKIINAIATGDMTGVENLSDEEQIQLNNIDSAFQNVLVGNYVEEIIEGGEPPVPTEEYFLTFSSPSSFTLNVSYNAKSWDGTLEYSVDKENWNEWDGTTVLNSGSGNELYLRGIGNTYITGDLNGIKLQLTGSNISCSGNIETLLDYQTVMNGQHPTIGNYCYAAMFSDCTSLTTAPALPATTLAIGCYMDMFAFCTALTQAPELPATTLADGCYYNMFGRCTSLTQAPKLPAITLAGECYGDMFRNCTSLITVPELPATTLVGRRCYENMFRNCTSLYVSDTQTSDAQYEWTIPTNGVITGINNYEQSDMFTNCLGTRSSDDLAGEVGQQYIYYTQNSPVKSN